MSGPIVPSAAPADEPSGDNHVTDQSDLPQVHRSSNGFVPRERNNNNANAAISFNPNNVNTDIANLDDDLVPITGSQSNQIFQSNVPKLSAHKLAILGSQYRSSKYKRGNPVERRIIRSSLRESKELQRIQREEFNRILHPTHDIVPAWAKPKTEDKTLKYSLIGVLIFLIVAAICVPLMWKLCEYLSLWHPPVGHSACSSFLTQVFFAPTIFLKVL